MVRDEEGIVYKLFKRERFWPGLWLREVLLFLFSVRRNILPAYHYFYNLISHVVQRKTFINLNGNLFCKLILICTFVTLHPILIQDLVEIFFLKSYIGHYKYPGIGLSL